MKGKVSLLNTQINLEIVINKLPFEFILYNEFLKFLNFKISEILHNLCINISLKYKM